MAVFPTEPAARVGSKTTNYIPLVKSESDGNYPKVRRLATKGRKKFTLKYDKLLIPEFEILNNFFEENQGLSFEFTHPESGITYNCVFMQDELPKDYVTSFMVNTEIMLEEI